MHMLTYNCIYIVFINTEKHMIAKPPELVSE